MPHYASEAVHTKTAYPLACQAIRSGKYRIEFLELKWERGPHQAAVIYRGNLLVADQKTPGAALRWIQEREERVLAGRLAS
jgi:hypothetical protein